MKLIDILVGELPKRGGWDAKWHQCAQDGNGEVCFFTDGEINFRRSFDAWSIPSHGVARHDGKARLWLLLADDYQETIITREQYEAALAASKRCDHEWIPSEGRTQSGYLCSKCGNYDGPGYDWIDWPGGECPVPTGTLVDVRYRDGEELFSLPADDLAPSCRDASFAFWRGGAQDNDIIAYRLHKPQEAAQDKVDDEADLSECIGQDAAPVWSGEGLPPVGEKVIFFINPRFDYATQGMPAEGREIEVVAHKKTSDGNDVAICYWDENGGGRAVCLVPESLMPAKSEADRKRDEAVKAIMLTGWCQTAAEEIYDLIAAGKVPGMKLGD